ncbi:MAG: S1 family peptidase [Aggregatilineales bacterium]
MKRLLLFFVAALALLPAIATAQARLGRDEINRIAQSVVYIVTLGRGDQAIASGSGTLVQASGLIYTNQHVIADGNDYMIYLLEDISEMPVHRYYAHVVREYTDLDFAILQIDRDASRTPVAPGALNLPHIELVPADVSLGDRVFVFGYPDIGGGYLVFTEGTISSIQSGTVAGQRLPAWYQTDAEIAPGNSGGLAVSESGVPLGIPTAVRTDQHTGGRLGGILPFGAVQALIEADQRGALPTAQPTPLPADRQLDVSVVQVEHNAVSGSPPEAGVRVYAYVRAIGYQGVPLRVAIFYYGPDGAPISGSRMPPVNRTPAGDLTIQEVIVPAYDNTEWPDLWFWMPYSAFPGGADATSGIQAEVEIGVDGAAFSAASGRVPLGAAQSAPAAALDYTLPPFYGTLTLRVGFLPDPAAVAVTSGGSVDVAAYLGGSCVGYAAPAPDVRLNWSGASSELRIFFEAAAARRDTTLIVNDPTGAWHCNDDANGSTLNPLIVLPQPRPGQYDIWVGSYSAGDSVAGTLYITETGLVPR